MRAGRLAVLELIVRQNILSGRAGPIMRRWGMSRAETFLARYIDQVAAHRASEYAAWMDAQRPDSAARLYQLILALAERIAPQFAWVPDGLSPANITSEAYLALVDAQRIQSYTLNVPWEAWLRQFVWLRARQLSVSGPSRRAATGISRTHRHHLLRLPGESVCALEMVGASVRRNRP